MDKVRHQSIDLVEFQNRLNESLNSFQNMGELTSLLGFVSGGVRWLINLNDLHEIESVPSSEKIQRIYLTKNWVMGVANYKGNIFTLVDFQQFLGKKATQADMNARSLLLHPRHNIQTALIVNEVTGLLAVNEMTKVREGGDKSWVKTQLKSKDGLVWNLINVEALSADNEMLNVAN